VSEKIRLIVGLGNPGTEYQQTRHNAGFWFVDRLAEKYRGDFRKDAKFFGETCKINIAGVDCWLLKPATFMNRSGRAVSALASYYKIDLDSMLVAHDELDHDAGVVKLKFAGGHAGHNGLRDIGSACGGNDYLRLRIGVGHPGHKNKVADFVLSRPGKEDQVLIDDSIERSLDNIEDIVRGDYQNVMSRLNSKE